MKNFISLSLIILLALSSCKTNSFMTQRYTKFGHAPAKQRHASAVAKHEKTVKTTPGEGIAAPPVNLTVEKEYANATAFRPERTTAQSHSTGTVKRIVTPLLKVGTLAVSQVKAGIKKSQEQNLKPQKNFKEKIQRAAGLFDTLFKIVLFSIILAILVAIIIIIILT